MSLRILSVEETPDEQEIQRICIALTQDKDAFLYRYRGRDDWGGYYWTLSNVLSLREYAMSQLEGTRLSDKEVASLAEGSYDAKSLGNAAWEVKESLILEMCDGDMLVMDEEKHQARATEVAYQIGEQLIKKWNL